MKIIAVVNGNQDFVQEQQHEREDIGDFLINPHLTQVNHHHHKTTNHGPDNHRHHTDNHHKQSLKERDAQFLQLQELIEQKKRFLLENQKKLKQISKQNEFLEHIKDDYFKYNDYVAKQKNDQMKALELLNEYIHDLSNSGELSEQNIKDSKHEQRKIMKEIKHIKSSLDSLIEGEESQINNVRNITSNQ
jgi:hypothetical protein